MLTSPLPSSATSLEIHAVIEGSQSAVPPLVSMSFQGLDEPVDVWAAVERIGWIVPPRPPRPASAIDWTTPDGFGNDYTVLPYRVSEFFLQPVSWDPAARALVGARTVSVLQQHNVRVHARESYLFDLVDVATRYQALQQRASPVEPEDGDPLPASLVIEYRRSEAAAYFGYRTFRVLAAAPAELVWAETDETARSQSGPEHQEMVKEARFAWDVSANDEIPRAVESAERSLRIVVPDARQGAEIAQRLSRLMDDRVGSAALEPAAYSRSTKHHGLLIIGVVNVDAIARVRQVLVSQHANILVRI